jgi:CDP-diacylglycerol---glycerol-3-phosphate 3-phosphatidyltransferase
MSARHRRTSSDGAIIAPVPLLGIDRAHEDVLSLVDRRSDYYRRTALEHHIHAHDAAAAAAAGGNKRTAARTPAAAARAAQQPSDTNEEPLLTLPNVLTFARLVSVPIVGLLWYSPHINSPLACALLFVAASLTDWLDGYLARRLELTSAFGAFLDPVADKVMVSTALVLLATTPPWPLSPQDLAAPVVIIIAREITISALREWAAGTGGVRAAVKVNSLGKWKTALQMVAMSVLMLGRDRSGRFQQALSGVARMVGVRPLEGGGGLAAAAGGGGRWSVPAGVGSVGGSKGEGFTSTLARAFGSMAASTSIGGPSAIPTTRPTFGAAVLAPAARRALSVEGAVLAAWVALWGAALLAVWSGAVYFRAAWSAFFQTVAHPAPTPTAAGRMLAVPSTPLTDAAPFPPAPNAPAGASSPRATRRSTRARG